MEVMTMTDCPRLPVPISVRNVRFSPLYKERWRITRTPLVHKLDIFFETGDSIWTILVFRIVSFAPAKWTHISYEGDDSGCIWKFWGNSVNLPSTEVHMNSGLKRAFICVNKTVSSTLLGDRLLFLFFPSFPIVGLEGERGRRRSFLPYLVSILVVRFFLVKQVRIGSPFFVILLSSSSTSSPPTFQWGRSWWRYFLHLHTEVKLW